MTIDSAKIMGFVPTRDMTRAKSFYVDILGLRCVHEDGFALALDANGIQVRVTKVEDFKPQVFTILGWDVRDVDATVKDLAVKGISFERYGMPNQDENGIWNSPSGARIAWFKDPDGNVLSVAEFPK